jgi:hypothetical protein
MCETDKPNFFQIEKKFVVGKSYETLRVKTPPWGTYVSNLETCDEIGTIIPNSEKFLGKYVSSQRYGYGDNGGRYDYFTNIKGETITNCLDYDGTTRYRKVKTLMDERINYIMLLEGTSDEINVMPPPPPSISNNVILPPSLNKIDVNEHINKYLFDENLVKEICSFMNPLI